VIVHQFIPPVFAAKLLTMASATSSITTARNIFTVLFIDSYLLAIWASLYSLAFSYCDAVKIATALGG